MASNEVVEASHVIDHYGDGARYDAEYVHIRGDIAHYTNIASATNGSILELACGTGRLTIPMAEAGADVVGVDLSSSMLRRAHEKWALLPEAIRDRLVFLQGDMRTVRLEQKFEAVVLGFNTLMHMTEDDDLLATLQTARHHLSDTGLFHLDLFTPFPTFSDRDPSGRYDPQEMIDPRTGARYIVSENNHYDPRMQINTMRFYYQRVSKAGLPIGPEQRADVRLRVLFPRELDFFMRLSRLEVVEDWDDFEQKRPFSGRGGRRVLSARARP